MRSAVEIADAVSAGEMTARTVIEQALARIERLDPSLNAFVHVDVDAALRAAADLDRRIAKGEDPGPLAGVPFGVKDNEDCASMPTRHGSLVHHDDAPATRDSVHIARLRAAGAIPVGKTATAEFGLDGVTHTLAHGTTRNPWNPERSPGGSSGGSAAVVAGDMVPLATGSDALGSIRGPAGFCGLLGLKPSHGRIPRAHGFKDTASLGAFTTRAADMARYLDAVAGPDHRDRMTLPPPGVRYADALDRFDTAGLRAAWSVDLSFAPVDPEVAAICEAALRRLVEAAGLNLVQSGFTCTNVYPEWNALAALEIMGEFERLDVLPAHIDAISPGPRSFIEDARALSPAEQAGYRAHIRRLEAEVAALYEDVDVLITPVACCDAYPAAGPMPTVIAGRDASRTHGEPFTAIGSVCWNPSIAVPAGFTEAGLPVGLLINGPRHRDEIVLRLARTWETASPWPRTAPRLEGPA